MAKITQENSVQAPDISAVLSRLEKIEAENKEMKEQLAGQTENKFKKAREHYKGPRLYSYKLWGGIPVVSYESVKKDKTKDWLFKNQYGEMESNHYLKLTLATKQVVEVEVNEFNSSFTRSEKQVCEVKSDGVSPTGFTFTDENFGTFTVQPNIIN